MGYLVMPRYSKNLHEYLISQKRLEGKIDKSEIFQIASQILSTLEIVHSSNRTYNDLKPQNIMIEKEENGDAFTILIDFGSSAKFRDSVGVHLEQPNESGSKSFNSQWWYASDKN